MRIITLVIACMVFFVSGCATQDSVRTQEGMNNRIKALDTRPDTRGAVMVVVPSADNALSNAMMLASINGGTQTNAVQTLTGMLKKGDRPVAVTGDHDGITAATIDSAMNNLQGAQSAARLFFIGDGSYGPELKKKAETLGIRFEVVSYPPAQ